MSSTAIVLKPGRNTITLDLPPQKPGSYVLGVLTGQIGQLRFRSHSFSKGGPEDSEDFMSYEKPPRPILKVPFLNCSCVATHYIPKYWFTVVLLSIPVNKIVSRSST